jgi:hypothetical protein
MPPGRYAPAYAAPAVTPEEEAAAAAAQQQQAPPPQPESQSYAPEQPYAPVSGGVDYQAQPAPAPAPAPQPGLGGTPPAPAPAPAPASQPASLPSTLMRDQFRENASPYQPPAQSLGALQPIGTEQAQRYGAFRPGYGSQPPDGTRMLAQGGAAVPQSSGSGGISNQQPLLAQFFDEAAAHARGMKLPPPKQRKITIEEHRQQAARSAQQQMMGGQFHTGGLNYHQMFPQNTGNASGLGNIERPPVPSEVYGGPSGQTGNPLTIQSYTPASGAAPTQNTYQSVDHMATSPWDAAIRRGQVQTDEFAAFRTNPVDAGMRASYGNYSPPGIQSEPPSLLNRFGNALGPFGEALLGARGAVAQDEGDPAAAIAQGQQWASPYASDAGQRWAPDSGGFGGYDPVTRTVDDVRSLDPQDVGDGLGSIWAGLDRWSQTPEAATDVAQLAFPAGVRFGGGGAGPFRGFGRGKKTPAAQPAAPAAQPAAPAAQPAAPPRPGGIGGMVPADPAVRGTSMNLTATHSNAPPPVLARPSIQQQQANRQAVGAAFNTGVGNANANTTGVGGLAQGSGTAGGRNALKGLGALGLAGGAAYGLSQGNIDFLPSDAQPTSPTAGITEQFRPLMKSAPSAAGVAAQEPADGYVPPPGTETPLPGSGYGARVRNMPGTEITASDTTLESRLGSVGAQMQRDGVIDLNGNWTPEFLAAGIGDGTLNADGSWSEQAYREGRVPRDAVGRYGVHYLQTVRTPPTEEEIAASGGPLNPDAVAPVSLEEVLAVEGGSGGGSGRQWVDYGSRGGGGYSRGGGGYSSGGGGYSGGGSPPDGFGSGGNAFDNPIFDRYKAVVGQSNPDWLAKLMHLGQSGGDGFDFSGMDSPPSKSKRRKTRRGKRGGKSSQTSVSAKKGSAAPSPKGSFPEGKFDEF